MSFKIGEGYVEVEGRVDQNSVRTAAQMAGRIAGNAIGSSMMATHHRHRDRFWREMFRPSPALLSALRTGIPGILASPIGAAGLALGVTFAGSFVGAVISSGMFALLGTGFTALGAFAVRENANIRAEFARTGREASDHLARSAIPMVPAYSDALRSIRNMFEPSIARPLRDIFEGIAPTIQPMAEGLVNTINRILEPMRTATFLSGFRKVSASIASEMPRLGDAVGEMFTQLANDADAIAEGFSNVVTVVSGLLGFLTEASITLTHIFNGFADFWNILADVNQEFREFGKVTGLDKVTEGIKSLNMNGVEALAWLRDWEQAADEWNYTGSDWIARLKELFTGTEETNEGVSRLSGSTRRFVSASDRGTKSTGRFATAMRDDASAAAQTLEERISELENVISDANKEADQLTRSLFDTGDAALTLAERQDALADAIDDAKDAADGHTGASRDERAALRQVARESHNLIETMVAQEASTDDVVSATERARSNFIKVAEQMGLTRGQARRLADQYGLVPKDIKTKVELIGAERAKARAASIRASIMAIKDRSVTMTVHERRIKSTYVNTFFSTYGTQGYSGQNRATGGITGAATGGIRGNQVLVGEHRPEVVELPVGSRVIPSVDQATDRNQAGLGMMSGGQLSVVLDIEGAEDIFVEAFRRAFRVRGITVLDGPTA